MHRLRHATHGFTLVEILIVVAISIVLISAAAPLYSNLQVSTQLSENTALVIQTLRTAQQRTIAGYGGSNHGVYFDIQPVANDRVILYQGNSYSTRDASFDRIITLDPALSIASTLDGDQVQFIGSAGTVQSTGTVRILHAVSGNNLITIGSYGIHSE